MATLIIHGTVPVKIPFTVKWWWDSWHENGFLHAMAAAMRSVSGHEDVWKVGGTHVARIAALDPQGRIGWKSAFDPNAWQELVDPRRYLDTGQWLVHQGCFMWSGSDMDSERRRAGLTLARYLNKVHELAPHEPLRLVAHSHGCNVVKIASSCGELHPAVFIARAVFLACPHFMLKRGAQGSYPYRLDPKRFGDIVNAYSPADSVQVDIAQSLPGPPENPDMVMGVFGAQRTEQDPAAKGRYRNFEVPTADHGVAAHGAVHGARMGGLVGAWLGSPPEELDLRYREAREHGLFPIPAGDNGE